MELRARTSHRSFALASCVSFLVALSSCGSAQTNNHETTTTVVIAEPREGGAPSTIAVAKKSKSPHAERAREPRAASNSDDDDTPESDDDLLAIMNGQAPFDRQRAAGQLSAIDASVCAMPNGQSGPGHAVLTFSPAGNVINVDIDPPFRGSAIGSCLQSIFSSVSVPPFKGPPTKVGKMFLVP